MAEEQPSRQADEAGKNLNDWRFFKYLFSMLERPGECWEYPGSHPSGYPLVSVRGQRTVAHRAAYETLIGEIPDGLEIDHLCRNTRCVNPRHLDPVTGRTNALRSMGVAAINHRKTHCLHGHEFDPENTIWKRLPNGFFSRACRPCKRRAGRERMRRVRAEAKSLKT